MSEYFRAGVGAVITDSVGRILVFHRRCGDGFWQLPQGGIEQGEEPTEAVWREVMEETGLGREELRVTGQLGEWLTYELPAESRSAKTGRGQVQWWFSMELHDSFVNNPPVVLGGLDAAAEFDACRWTTPQELVEQAVPFRRLVYERIAFWLNERDQATDR